MPFALTGSAPLAPDGALDVGIDGKLDAGLANNTLSVSGRQVCRRPRRRHAVARNDREAAGARDDPAHQRRRLATTRPASS